MYDTDSRLDQSMPRGHQYELETKRIRVAVKPAYLDDQSDPEDDRYVWSYTVTIENRGAEPVQLLSRYWNIVDGSGRIQEVRGPGGQIERVTTRAINSLNRVAALSNAAGQTTTLSYDANGQPVARTSPLGRQRQRNAGLECAG